MRCITARSHDAVIFVYDEAGNVIETHQHKGDFRATTRFGNSLNNFGDCLRKVALSSTGPNGPSDCFPARAWERLTRASMSARKCYDRYELSGTEAVSLARARKQSVGSAAIVPPSSSMPPNSNKTATCNT